MRGLRRIGKDWRALVLTVLVCAALGVGVALESIQLYVAGFVVACLATWIGYSFPRALVGATVVVAVFVQTAEMLLPTVAAVSNADEAMVALCVLSILVPTAALSRLRSFPGLPWFGAFVAFGLASAVIQHVPVNVTLSGALLAAKGFVVAWAAIQLDWDQAALRRVVYVGGAVFAFALVCGAVNFLVPGAWTAAIGSPPTVEYRGPLPSLIGPWKHPSYFGQMMALLAIAALAYRQAFSKQGYLWMVAGAVAAFLSFRRKTWVGLLAALGALAWRRTPFLLLLFGIPGAILLGIAFWGSIHQVFDLTWTQYIFEADESPRTLLFKGSFTVANQHFPFGAGFGRYGSFTAFNYYSPEYLKLGFESIYGLGTNAQKNRFATDTFWPAVWGEAGWLGAAAYVGGLVAMGRAVVGSLKHADPWVRFLAILSAGWGIELLIESIAAPIFNGPPTYPLLFTAVAVLASARRVSERRGEVPAVLTESV